MEIFVDVDYTILGLDGSLRPWTRDTFERLTADGHRIHIWSGNGIRTREIEEHRLEHLVIDCYQKPLANHEAALDALGVPFAPDFVIDDSIEIPTIFGGVLVAAYTAGTPSDYVPRDRDEELKRAYDIVQEYIATGTSTDRRFYPKGSKTSLL